MSTEAMRRLLAAVLADQPERADVGMALDEVRLRRVLSGEESLPDAEQHLFWTSPAAALRQFW